MNPEESELKSPCTGAVLVVGGGVGGIQAALDLAESGYYVYLAEESPGIGGVMAQLDKTFPTNDCSLCILSPKLVECGRHHNIEVITNATVNDIEGDSGNFTVSIIKEPRYVDEEKCVGCGICAEKCPTKVFDAFDENLAKRKAIYVKYPQAVPLVYMIDKEHCIYFKKGKCRSCEKVCESKAIDFEQKQKEISINVGAIILAPGFEEFDPEPAHLARYGGYTNLISQYGYKKYPNVVTSIQFERILSASGPFEGHLARPSDRKPPQKIAWIQCVGSRDVTCHSGFCSSVCCMYAIKEAVIAKEHSDIDLDITIFYMDMRTYGKDFDKYYERARLEHGIQFIRSKVYGVEELDDTGDLALRYTTEEGITSTDTFDLVILSVGMKAPPQMVALAQKTGIELNQYDFCKTDNFSPVSTSKEGIYVCGAFQGPKDIPETVMQASGAAGSAQALLSSSRGTLVKEKVYPPEKDVTGEPPRVGVFVCHCGINIGGVVDVPSVKDYAATLKNVVYADDNLYTCSQDAQEKIKEKIAEHNINRIVVAACTPRTHEPLFQETIQEAGLNKYLFEMANIRDQCSWVHQQQLKEATEKARDLVKMAVAKASMIEPLKRITLQTTPAALVIGGGIAGMVSALNLADQSFEVHLVEKAMNLGGIARKIHFTLEGGDVQTYLKELVEKVNKHPLIQAYTRTTIAETSGYIGNFITRLKTGSKKDLLEINHGVVIIATGGEEHKPTEYLFKKNRRVVSLLELERDIAKKSKRIKDCQNLVMIQCVGSRNEERPYCGRVCCSESLKCALSLKNMNPEINIYILYRDLRAYGFKEDFYREAREKGIIFIHYEPEDKPEINPAKAEGKEIIKVSVTEPLLGEKLIIDADLVALALGTNPPAANKDLSQFFKVPLNAEGFFLEAHMKLRPVEFATDGVFMCGLAHSPKFIEESIAQAQAAADRAAIIISKSTISGAGIVAAINARTCSGCKLCVSLCPYEAISFNDEQNIAEVNEVLCKGCGNCAAACPSGACTLGNFKDEQLLAQVEVLLQ